ncbi:MAG: CPBP family glutamic-type intramembrane protease [Gaiellaceae bacterium]
MTGLQLWLRFGTGTAFACVLLAFVQPPEREAWPVLPAVAVGLVCGASLFVGIERRPPTLPRPIVAVDVWLAKHAALGLWAGVEEVVWRRTVLGELARVLPALAALAVSSLAFGLCHRARSPLHVVAGLVFGAVFLAGGSLAGAWAAHAAYNGSIAVTAEAARARAEGVPP